jgi:hypothetical protein
MGRLIHCLDDVVSRPDELINKARIAIQISVSIGPDARLSVKEIANSTLTIRTSASHGPDALIADMEIAC